MPSQLRTCLWFANRNGKEAAEFYVSLLPDSRIDGTFGQTPSGEPLVVNFTLMGMPYQALNGGPPYELSEAVSIALTTHDQQETDKLWDALIADGGEPLRCGWLKDRFGLSWQIIPEALMRCIGAPDLEASGRATQAMFQMQKIDIATLEAAFRGECAAD